VIAGQLPDQPAVHRAEQHLAAARALSQAVDVVEQPGKFGPGEVRCERQARTVLEVLLAEGGVEAA
jgi:hypothetical protein